MGSALRLKSGLSFSPSSFLLSLFKSGTLRLKPGLSFLLSSFLLGLDPWVRYIAFQSSDDGAGELCNRPMDIRVVDIKAKITPIDVLTFTYDLKDVVIPPQFFIFELRDINVEYGEY